VALGASTPVWTSRHVLGAPTVSIPTEGDFTQELIRPSECGHWTILPGVVFRREHPRGRGGGRLRTPHPAGGSPTGRRADQGPEADYKRFNRSNVSIRRWSWNYRSCWHQTCPPVGTHHGVWIASIPSPTSDNAGGIAAARCCLTRCFCIGQFARLLPTLVVAAVSQAPSPESNPNSPSPVAATVVHYATVLS